MNEVILDYALRDGEFVNISDVENGLACNCICPECEGKLIAKKGDIQQHHFSHADGLICSGRKETKLHIHSKEVFALHSYIVLPPLYLIYHRLYPKYEIYPAQKIKYDEVILEKKIGNIIPDIIVITQGKPLIIEIADTHLVSYLKAEQIRDMRYSAIQINVGYLFWKAFNKSYQFLDFDNLLITETECKSWINNEKKHLVKHQVKQFLNKNQKRKKAYSYIEDDGNGFGSKRHYIVYDCPLKINFFKFGKNAGKGCALVYGNCNKCFFGNVIDNGENKFVDCSGHLNSKVDSLIQEAKKNFVILILMTIFLIANTTL